MKLRALIADDEPLARERLRFLLSDDKDVEIAGECRKWKRSCRGVETSALRRTLSGYPDAGYEWVRGHRGEIGLDRMPLTIFVTAHNHYAV